MHVDSGFQPGDHGSTFGGSPIPCAVALAHLRVRDELDLDARVRARSRQLFRALEELAAKSAGVLGPPRGMNLLVGMRVREPYEAAAIVAQARESGFAPPSIVSKAEHSRAVAITSAISRHWRDDRYLRAVKAVAAYAGLGKQHGDPLAADVVC